MVSSGTWSKHSGARLREMHTQETVATVCWRVSICRSSNYRSVNRLCEVVQKHKSRYFEKTQDWNSHRLVRHLIAPSAAVCTACFTRTMPGGHSSA